MRHLLLLQLLLSLEISASSSPHASAPSTFCTTFLHLLHGALVLRTLLAVLLSQVCTAKSTLLALIELSICLWLLAVLPLRLRRRT